MMQPTPPHLSPELLERLKQLTDAVRFRAVLYRRRSRRRSGTAPGSTPAACRTRGALRACADAISGERGTSRPGRHRQAGAERLAGARALTAGQDLRTPPVRVARERPAAAVAGRCRTRTLCGRLPRSARERSRHSPTLLSNGAGAEKTGEGPEDTRSGSSDRADHCVLTCERLRHGLAADAGLPRGGPRAHGTGGAGHTYVNWPECKNSRATCPYASRGETSCR